MTYKGMNIAPSVHEGLKFNFMENTLVLTMEQFTGEIVITPANPSKCPGKEAANENTPNQVSHQTQQKVGSSPLNLVKEAPVVLSGKVSKDAKLTEKVAKDTKQQVSMSKDQNGLKKVCATRATNSICHMCHSRKDVGYHCCPLNLQNHTYCSNHLESQWNLTDAAITSDPSLFSICPACTLTCPCPSCQRTLTNELTAFRKPAPAPRKRKQREETQQEDGSSFLCSICQQGGELLCCDFCPRVFHFPCVKLLKQNIPKGKWICQFCKEEEKADYFNKVLPAAKGKKGILDLCDDLVEFFFNHEFAGAFRKPVNLHAPGLEDYAEFVVRPMDLGTVRKRLRQGGYISPIEVFNDLQLIWRNSKEYNFEGSAVWRMANHLSKLLERAFEWLMKPYLREGDHKQESPKKVICKGDLHKQESPKKVICNSSPALLPGKSTNKKKSKTAPLPGLLQQLASLSASPKKPLQSSPKKTVAVTKRSKFFFRRRSTNHTEMERGRVHVAKCLGD